MLITSPISPIQRTITLIITPSQNAYLITPSHNAYLINYSAHNDHDDCHNDHDDRHNDHDDCHNDHDDRHSFIADHPSHHTCTCPAVKSPSIPSWACLKFLTSSPPPQSSSSCKV